MSSSFDTIVVGGGFAGILLSNALTRAGQNVALVESLGFLGGAAKQNLSPFGTLPSCLQIIPSSTTTRRSLEFIETLLGESLDVTESEFAPKTYQKGAFAPFVGFGSLAPDCVEELSYYACQKHLQTKTQPSAWLERLASLGCGEVFLNSQVTRLTLQDSKVTGLFINGQASPLRAENFVFCGPARQLLSLVPKEVLGSRSSNRLSHSKEWTSILLQLVHSAAVSESLDPHLLYGGTEEIHACVGQFSAPVLSGNQTCQMSSWATFVHVDSSHEEEITGLALREIKRQIKRAYPAALEKPLFEKISIHIGSHGEVPLKLSAQCTLPGASNLWIASRGLNPFKNITGTVAQVQMVLASMGLPMGREISDELRIEAAPDFVETTVDHL